MLQNARVAAFTASELLRESQQEEEGGGGRGLKYPPPLTQIRVNKHRIVSNPRSMGIDVYKLSMSHEYKAAS